MFSMSQNYHVICCPRKSIGSAKEYGGLHNFKEDNTKDGQVLSVGCESSQRTKQQEIVLWHFRLGHLNFQYLKHLFPSFFNNKDGFQCDIYQFAKHQRSNYPSQPYKASKMKQEALKGSRMLTGQVPQKIKDQLQAIAPWGKYNILAHSTSELISKVQAWFKNLGLEIECCNILDMGIYPHLEIIAHHICVIKVYNGFGNSILILHFFISK